jgi:hypothetical protein
MNLNRRNFLKLFGSNITPEAQTSNIKYLYTNSINELRKSNFHLNKNTFVQPLGHTESGDCAMPYYQWDEKNIQNDNNGSIIRPDDIANAGRWVAVITNSIYVDWFGAGTGKDDTNAVSTALQTGILLKKKVKFSSGKVYKVISTIKTTGTVVLEGEGKLGTIIECYSRDTSLDLDGYGCEIRNLHFKNKSTRGSTAIRLSGKAHVVENLRFDGAFENCIHLVDVWESNFDKINILNGYPKRTGIGLLIDYSTNNTISNCYFSYNSFAIKFTPKYSPGSYRSEGWLISNSIFIDSLNGIFAEGITHISIQNCIFDFIYECAIYLAHGFSGLISGNWLSATAKGISLVVTHKSFNGAKVIGNEFVGSPEKLANQSSLLITGNQNILGNNRHIGISSGRNFSKVNIQNQDLYIDFNELQNEP